MLLHLETCCRMRIQMKKSMRIFAVLSVLIILFIGMSSGCIETSHKSKMLSYLKNKYHQEFTAKVFCGKSWAYNYDELSAYPVGKEDQVFLVRGENTKWGFYTCHDNYYEYIIRDDYEKAISDIVGNYFTDFKVYMQPSEGMHDDRLNYGVKVEDIYDYDKRFLTELLIFVKQDNTTDKDLNIILQKIATKMIEKRLMGTICIYPTFNNKYELVNRNNLNEILNEGKEWTESYMAIGVNPNFEIVNYNK